MFGELQSRMLSRVSRPVPSSLSWEVLGSIQWILTRSQRATLAREVKDVEFVDEEALL